VEEGLLGPLEYNTDLYDEATVQRMLGHFYHLLEQIVDAPDRKLSEYDVLTAAERHQLLVEWNPSTSTQVSRDFPLQSLHALFEKQAACTPDAAAVTFANETLTYAELNARANQVAHHLQKRGAVPGQRIGLAVERSLNVVVGVLGILKSGAAYVPLDPTYPAERLAFMMEDSQMSIVLTQQKWLDELPPHDAETVCLDREWAEIAQEPDTNPVSGATADDLAYVIYTSGSTGKPKGVLINHGNAVRLFAETEAWYGFDEQDVWTLFHSYAFDFSVWEIWGALLYGGRLVVVPYLTSREPESFYQLLIREGVTVLNQTPSAFRQLIRVDEGASANGNQQNLSLRYVIFGGEALELQSLKPWFDLHGDQTPQLVNMYGITETTVHVTYRPITQADLAAGKGSVIGRPIPDLQVYVLDPQGQPVPIGVPGEMYVGGRGVAQGYLNRSELTDERFVNHPFVENGQNGERLYRTGDLARFLSNGDLEYLGRIDHQVKLRGFRIELGEIEAVLAQYPAIREAVVLVREDVPGDQRLVAYLVAKDALPESAELRRHVASHLPEHMVPSAYVLLESLPLTANGKVDRKALPAPAGGVLAERNETYVAPRDALESELVRIWEELLGTSPVGIRENFFALGGHSLLAVRLMSQLKKQFGQDLPLALLFQGGTIEQLADLLRRQGLAPTHASLVPIQPHGDKAPFFCVHPVGGSVFCYNDLSLALGSDQPFYGLQARGLEQGQEPLTLIQEMAASYIDEMRSVQSEGPYHLGGWSLGGIVAFEMAHQLRRAGQEVASLVLFDSFAPELIRQQGEIREGDSLRSFAYDLAGGVGVTSTGEVPEWFAQLDGMESESALRLLFQQVTTYNFMANDESSYEQFCRLFRVFQANLLALQSYEPERYMHDVTLLRASVRPLQAEQNTQFDLNNGWQPLVKGELTVHEVPGDHFTILQQPRVQTVAAKLRETWVRNTSGLEVHE
jgi:amino acid adenylation domain-containing protein